ncbi:hypothetical protein Scinn_56010 [Streptomyces virginiae]|uniref:Uncharacterized protein n=1 Tax=Streptomyces virginiae TaxID=1961 RepID=A0ABQ3NTM4_STRVG|nr:hypothetical protein Scinn_56010 [Streptomyces virginiae]
MGLTRLLGPRPGLRDARGQHEVLAQRVPLEVLREEEVHQVRVVGEGDPEHLEGLALVPFRARVDGDRRRQGGGAVRDGRAQQQAAYAVVLQRGDVRADPEAGPGLVHRAQPVEVRAAQLVPGDLQGGDPAADGHVHREDVVGELGDGLGAEDRRRRVGEES